MAQLLTNVPHPTALPCKETVVNPKEMVIGVVVTSQVRNTAPTVTVLPKQVRIPIVPSVNQSIMVAQDIPGTSGTIGTQTAARPYDCPDGLHSHKIQPH